MYAVFGVCVYDAGIKAQKIVPEYRGDGGGIVPLTLEEFSLALDGFTDYFFDHAKPKKISPIYSNREQAVMFQSATEDKGSAHVSIKRRIHPQDENGNPRLDPKTRRTPYEWIPG